MSKPFVTTSHAGLSRFRRMLLLGLLLTVGACQQTPSDAGRAPVAAPPPPTDSLAVEPGLSSGTAAEVGLSSGTAAEVGPSSGIAAATTTVRQSPNDNRRYRYRTL
ncbi:MAG: hypothetical protein ACKOBM_04915, partial [Gammaproteobacteria bacterium]